MLSISKSMLPATLDPSFDIPTDITFRVEYMKMRTKLLISMQISTILHSSVKCTRKNFLVHEKNLGSSRCKRDHSPYFFYFDK